MKKEGLYTSGEFAKKAHVTKKTLRYYNDHGFLTPSYVEENGYKLYTDRDFEKMQRILFLKYLGFSLADVQESTPETINSGLMDEPENDRQKTLLTSLEQQLNLLDEKIKQMSLVREALQNTMEEIRTKGSADWSLLMKQVTDESLKKSLMQQYINTSNISIRIKLHSLYSQNTEKWFPWIYRNCGIISGMNILEIGCGNGDFWLQNMDLVPKKIKVILSDNSEGVLKEAGERFAPSDKRFHFSLMDMENLDLPNASADMVIANHVLFYAGNLNRTLKEIRRVLKPGGTFICSTYGPRHMKEISELAKGFDDRIVLAAKDLYEIFGKTNGKKILEKQFSSVEWREYEDSLVVTDEKDLTDYITSCHGNQNQYIVDNYKEFRKYVHSEIGNGFHVTKEAGIFICR
ncbi:MAG: methyltransferase domain-containing protein [Lachnospiraceae bacterium]|nr:methyltransferase domain-containing protein [Lachnospiraceae bacterium]